MWSNEVYKLNKNSHEIGFNILLILIVLSFNSNQILILSSIDSRSLDWTSEHTCQIKFTLLGDPLKIQQYSTRRRWQFVTPINQTSPLSGDSLGRIGWSKPSRSPETIRYSFVRVWIVMTLKCAGKSKT